MEYYSTLDVKRYEAEILEKLGRLLDIITVEAGGKEGTHIKLLVEIDITKPMQRGTKAKI